MLYLTTWYFSRGETDGVCKKIKSQVVFFKKQGYEVDVLYIKGKEIAFKEGKCLRKIGEVGNVKKTMAYLKLYSFLKDKKYDYIYNRYGMMDSFYYRVLNRLHKNGAKIVIEMPTYPYDGEQPDGFLYWLLFRWDRIYRNKLKKVIDRIVTYSRDNEIFGIPTIQIRNGIDLTQVRPIAGKDLDDTVDLLAVALMQPYHGYERLLMGLNEYYRDGGKRKILLHLVGDGPEKKAYEKIVCENGLQDKVIFYGPKGGSELDKIYERADIGICTLGGYKKGLYWSSELKSREYLAKGLPIVVGMELDVAEVIDKRFMFQCKNDDSVVKMQNILDFYDEVYQEGRLKTVMQIRKMAEMCLSMDATMKPISEYLQ